MYSRKRQGRPKAGIIMERGEKEPIINDFHERNVTEEKKSIKWLTIKERTDEPIRQHKTEVYQSNTLYEKSTENGQIGISISVGVPETEPRTAMPMNLCLTVTVL